MRNKNFVILGIILIVVAISIIGFYLLEKANNGSPSELAECEKLEGIEKDTCINEIAVNTNNSSLCDEIKDEDKKHNCRAQATGEVRFCEDISDTKTKSQCFNYLSFALNDIFLCNKVSDKDNFRLCQVVIKEEPKLCRDVKIEDEDGCYSFIASIKKDSSICDEIVGEIPREQCKADVEQGVFEDLAVKREEYKNKQEESKKKDEASIKSAIETNDSSICAGIHNAEIKDECYNGIAINTKDISLCDGIEEKDKEQSCKARITQDEKFCELITDSIDRDWCYSGLASSLSDILLCDKISNEYMLTLCEAMVLKDSKLCEEIQNPFLKESCLEIIK